MRDPERIPKVMAGLQELWEQLPDLRLGQLLTILCGNADTFHIEDDELSISITNFNNKVVDAVNRNREAAGGTKEQD